MNTGVLLLTGHRFEQSSRKRSPNAEAVQDCGGWRSKRSGCIDRQKAQRDKQEDRPMASHVGCINSGNQSKLRPLEELGVLSFRSLTHLLHEWGGQMAS